MQLKCAVCRHKILPLSWDGWGYKRETTNICDEFFSIVGLKFFCCIIQECLFQSFQVKIIQSSYQTFAILICLNCPSDISRFNYNFSSSRSYLLFFSRLTIIECPLILTPDPILSPSLTATRYRQKWLKTKIC